MATSLAASSSLLPPSTNTSLPPSHSTDWGGFGGLLLFFVLIPAALAIGAGVLLGEWRRRLRRQDFEAMQADEEAEAARDAQLQEGTAPSQRPAGRQLIGRKRPRPEDLALVRV